jgi:LPS sulfotransferase NodH
MTTPFETFVIFAEMRTGSNFLETNLNALAGVTCCGEAFNPYFIGYPNKTSLLGVTQDARDANPGALLSKIRGAEGLTGFRFFHDHDARILDAVLDDPRCAKIVLTRNPVESFVSWKIAQQTGQWKLTDVARRKEAKAHFDPIEFAEHLEALQTFQTMLTRRLQVSGQTAFRIDYDDLQSLDVMNGLAAFLGIAARLEKLDDSLKVQNPALLAQKVSNFDEMQRALSDLGGFDAQVVPNHEPRRTAGVTTYVTAARAPLVYLPIRGGPQETVTGWLAALDGVPPSELPTHLSQKALRQWKKAHQGHRSFTAIRHPVARAHHAYCSYILGTGPRVYSGIRHNLARQTGGAIPSDPPDARYDVDSHRRGFMAFLEFLQSNINGQTAIRVDAAWCSQSEAIRGFGQFALPDLILREDELAQVLPALAENVGCGVAPDVPESAPDRPFALTEIYDDDIEARVAGIYTRDYMMFGFGTWG